MQYKEPLSEWLTKWTAAARLGMDAGISKEVLKDYLIKALDDYSNVHVLADMSYDAGIAELRKRSKYGTSARKKPEGRGYGQGHTYVSPSHLPPSPHGSPTQRQGSSGQRAGSPTPPVHRGGETVPHARQSESDATKTGSPAAGVHPR